MDGGGGEVCAGGGGGGGGGWNKIWHLLMPDFQHVITVNDFLCRVTVLYCNSQVLFPSIPINSAISFHSIFALFQWDNSGPRSCSALGLDASAEPSSVAQITPNVPTIGHVNKLFSKPLDRGEVSYLQTTLFGLHLPSFISQLRKLFSQQCNFLFCSCSVQQLRSSLQGGINLGMTSWSSREDLGLDVQFYCYDSWCPILCQFCNAGCLTTSLTFSACHANYGFSLGVIDCFLTW